MLAVLPDSGITTYSQLDCKKIAVSANTAQYNELIAYQKAKNIKFHLRLFTDNSEAVDWLSRGKVKANYSQKFLLNLIIASSPDPVRFTFVNVDAINEPMALMMRKKNALFQGLVNQALLKLFEKNVID